MIKIPQFNYSEKFIHYLWKKDYYIEIVTSRVICQENMLYIMKLFGRYIHGIKMTGIDGLKIDYLNKNRFNYWIDDMPKGYEKLKKNIKVLLISNNNTLYNHYLREKFDYYKNVKEIMKLGVL
jgi:hypothetical protein